jgi:hypothetical protein
LGLFDNSLWSIYFLQESCECWDVERGVWERILKSLCNRLIICKNGLSNGGRRGRDCAVVGFKTTCTITTNMGIVWQGILDTTLCDKVYQWFATGQWFSDNTDRHDVAEIRLKVALDTINLNLHLRREA